MSVVSSSASSDPVMDEAIGLFLTIMVSWYSPGCSGVNPSVAVPLLSLDCADTMTLWRYVIIRITAYSLHPILEISITLYWVILSHPSS